MSTERFKIRSRAPTRIDLAGGTLDIWPLFLLLKNPVTVNVGIDLFADVSLTETLAGTGSLYLRSEDQAIEARLTWDRLEGPPPNAALELPFRLLRHFKAEKEKRGTFQSHTDLSIVTRAKSPAGAGLGGSSSLNIALTGALATWSHGQLNLEQAGDGATLLRVARDTETQVIRVPAGLQDYYAALYGGLQALHWAEGAHRPERLPASRLAELEKRLLLFYSGQSRNSGINNWQLFKNFIDGVEETRSRFEAIGLAAQRLEEAARAGDWAEARAAIDSEWEVRRTLATGISTAQMEAAFNRVKEEAPEVCGKVCGAGGGGCFFLFLPDADEELAAHLKAQLLELGIQSLPFQVVSQGLKIQSGWE